MMGVSNDLLAKFAKMSKESKIKRESTMYGITVEYGGKLYVKMDGSDLLTPVVTTSEVSPGERVTVMIKDHTATITGNISNPSASTGTTDGIKGELSAVVTDFGNFKELVADKAMIGELNAEIAKIGELVAIKADIIDLEAAQADIGKLYAKDAEIDKALITKAEIVDLEAAHADISILEADMAEIQTLVGGNLTMDNIQSLVLTASKVTVDNAFIKDAMVDRISASKINTGTLNTNLVNISSTDGSMTLNGSLQQFRDSNGRVRIQIGKDASGDFTFVLYGPDGRGQLINQNGITASAIGDGLIVNDMVADNANISGSKLDINSVIQTINEDGTETINGTKIYLDDRGQSLEVAFNQLQTSVEDDVNGVLEQVQTNATNLEVAQGQINALISNSSITKEDGTIVSIKDELNSIVNTVDSHSQTISSLETTYDSITGEMASVSSATSKLEQDLDGFKMTVSSNYYDKTTLNSAMAGMNQDISQVTSRVQKVEQQITPDGIMTTVENSDLWGSYSGMAQTAYSQSNQNADKISWIVGSGTSSSNMTLTDDALQIIADNIDLTGKVTFNSFSSDVVDKIDETVQDVVSTTEIDGGRIITRTITADKIAVGAINARHIASEVITSDHIASGTITADQIASNTITAAEIASGTITADKLAAGVISAPVIEAGSIKSEHIASNAITSDKIAAGAIQATDIAAEAITSVKIASGAITSDKISAYAITSTHIGSEQITAYHIKAGTITAAEIASATITADEIAGNTITSAEIAAGAIRASELAAGAVTADKIAAGAVTADHISARAISVDKISSNNENPVITLFDQCEIDASYLNGQGKGNAIRFKWDDENYVYVGKNAFVIFQSSYPDHGIFRVTADYNATYLHNVDGYILTMGDNLAYRNSTVLTAGNYSSYCASSSHSHSGYASSSHTHDIIYYGDTSNRVEAYDGYIYFKADAANMRFDCGASGYGWAYKLAPTTSGIDLGNSGDWQRWRTLYIQSIDQSSDIKYKENIMYLDEIVTYDLRDANSTPFLDFIKNEFKPALYDYKVIREEEGRRTNDSQLGFIANDIINTEVGQTFLYDSGTEEETNLSFSTTGYTTVVARALQEEIKVRDDQIVMLESMIFNLEERLSALENNNFNEVDTNGNES